jgi:hypothetical protein
VPAGPTRFMTTWLPRWRTSMNPIFLKALIASSPEIRGNLGTCGLERRHERLAIHRKGEFFEIKFGRFPQVLESIVYGSALADGSDFGTVGNPEVTFLVKDGCECVLLGHGHLFLKSL